MAEFTIFPQINVELLVFFTLIFVVVGVGILLFLLRKKSFGIKSYPIFVEIVEERAGNKILSFDRSRRI
ncbi:MAG: hypothetical protein NZ893_01535 [Candidatus Aenigmarchaeota archaeon]|nr:hypothetical protein [Candidatus Aenigmarchaeota archaeon]